MKDEKPGLSRRELFGLTGAAAATGLFTPAALGAETAPLPQVPRRVLGKTRQSVPILLMGGAMGFDQRFDPRLAEAVRFGVDYVDAADCYAGGKCETGVGAYLGKAKNRDKIWITSKSDRHDPEGLEQTLSQGLSRMQTTHVDLYYMHGIEDKGVLSSGMARMAEKLKKEGKIRFFGFSCHGNNVVELLNKAAGLSWIDSIMFRYNFRSYGNKELNEAIDAAHRSGIGLIAMKTQGSEASFADAWKQYEKTGKWNKYQAVLKAVWADKRISAAVSHMDSFEKLRENVAAALDRTSLTEAEQRSLTRYAEATRSFACDGCDHICGPALSPAAAPVRIADTIRYVMYHDAYGETAKARELFGRLPEPARRLQEVDFAPANRACPHGVDVAGLMKRAGEVLV